ncbi:MAG: ribose-phosphate diphosphokinase [Candidatus Hydrothermarchaeaceae archaeon]
MSERIIFGGSTCQSLAREVAGEIDCGLGKLTIKWFPDGERYLRVESDVKGKDCIVIQSTSKPQDANIMELLQLLDTLKENGAANIATVVPYFGYGRQDKSFSPGENVTSKTVAKHIELNSDAFYSINIHKKHIMDSFEIPATELDASPILGEYFKTYGLEAPVVIGPDDGAERLAKEVANIIGCPFDYLEKKRLGPERVEMKPKNIDVAKKDVILIDDIIDSGGTMIEAIKMLQSRGAANILIGAVHPVLIGNVIARLFSGGAADLVATNTINSQISYLTVSSLIAEAIR